MLEKLPHLISEIVASKKHVLGSHENKTYLMNESASNHEEGKDHLLRSFLQKCWQICLISFESQSPLFLAEVSAILVELTVMSNQYIVEFANIQQLAQQTVQMLEKSNNMQVIINCVYICGNLHCLEIEERVIYILNKLYTSYPMYENCMGLMIWYLRNCLLIQD